MLHLPLAYVRTFFTRKTVPLRREDLPKKFFSLLTRLHDLTLAREKKHVMLVGC